MARLFSNVALDVRTVNLNLLVSTQTGFDFYDNVYETYNGVQYQDVAVFTYDGGFAAAYFGGTNVVFNATQTAVLSGTATGFLQEYYSGGQWRAAWALDQFAVSAKSLSDAILTSGRTDDLAVIAKVLAGADTISLSPYADVMRGYAGNDTMAGAGGNDGLFGDGGNDVINGGSGADTLVGGAGRDLMSGGTGRDVFDFNAVADTGAFAASRDVIRDFVRNTSTVLGDRIDVSGIDARAWSTGTNEAFTFIGRSAFGANATGQLRYVVDSVSGFAVVLGSTDADADAEFAIQVNGVTTLTAADFVL